MWGGGETGLRYSDGTQDGGGSPVFYMGAQRKFVCSILGRRDPDHSRIVLEMACTTREILEQRRFFLSLLTNSLKPIGISIEDPFSSYLSNLFLGHLEHFSVVYRMLITLLRF
jgi:hypothetical protein